tara:strand:+ start:137 stop:283 length:147 start_codon:yes stop_codon:yes gene_type:complete
LTLQTICSFGSIAQAKWVENRATKDLAVPAIRNIFDGFFRLVLELTLL